MNDDPPKDFANNSEDGITANSNTAPVAQAVVKLIDRTPNWVYLLLAVIALVFAIALWLDTRRMSSEFDDVRRMLENAQAAALDSVASAARAAAKAETATARANTAEIYAYQVYIELNRLGYPVKSPAEAHDPHPPEPVKGDP